MDVNPYAPPQVDSRAEAAEVAIPSTISVQFTVQEMDLVRVHMAVRALALKWKVYRLIAFVAVLPACAAVFAAIVFLLNQLGWFQFGFLTATVVAASALLVAARLVHLYILDPLLAKEAVAAALNWQRKTGIGCGEWQVLLEPSELVLRDSAGATFHLPLPGTKVIRCAENNRITGFNLCRNQDVLHIPTTTKCSVPWHVFDQILHARCK